MLSGSVNTQTGSSLTYGIDLPVTLDYNFGAGALEGDEGDSKIDGFIGGGFGYTYSSVNNSWSIPGTIVVNEDVKGSSYGPIAHAGVRFVAFNQPLTLRLSFKYGLEKARFKTFGGSIYYNF